VTWFTEGMERVDQFRAKNDYSTANAAMKDLVQQAIRRRYPCFDVGTEPWGGLGVRFRGSLLAAIDVRVHDLVQGESRLQGNQKQEIAKWFGQMRAAGAHTPVLVVRDEHIRLRVVRDLGDELKGICVLSAAALRFPLPFAVEAERRLLIDIVRCPVLSGYLRGEATDACRTIIEVQLDSSGRPADEAQRQVPEPWTGHLGSAPVLFLASNPGFSDVEVYPPGGRPDHEYVDFFTHRFDPERPWTKDGNQYLERTGLYSKPVRYWSFVRNRAMELLGRQPMPGRDYVLAEVVHCKSANEVGVADARGRCAREFLFDLLGLSGARLVVVHGTHAAAAVRGLDRLVLEPVRPDWPELQQEQGRERFFLFQPHPNERGSEKVYSRALSTGLLPYLQSMFPSGDK